MSESFTAGRAELGTGQSMLGHALMRLEPRLGKALLHRSKRHLNLPDEGAIFLEVCRRVLEAVGQAERQCARSQISCPRNRLRIPTTPALEADQ